MLSAVKLTILANGLPLDKRKASGERLEITHLPQSTFPPAAATSRSPLETASNRLPRIVCSAPYGIRATEANHPLEWGKTTFPPGPR